jgi:hypothetical protein
MNSQHPTPDDTYPVPLLNNRDLDALAAENLPRDTLPCMAPPPPPSSLAAMSIDLTADYLDEP